MAGPANRSGNHATMQNVAFTRWDPLRDLIALHDQIGQLVGHDAPGWTPPVDLYETSNAFILTAERSSHVPCEQYHRVEPGHGPFSRAFVLPEPIDVEAVTADFKEGLLTLTLPKAGGRGARRVDVS